jgi:hypothetical protein
MAEEIEFGTKVRFHVFLRRGDQEARQENSYGWFRKKVWYPTDGPIHEGIVVGKRTLSNGIRESHDDYLTYTGKEFFEVYLVAFAMRRRPAFVRPEDLEVIND